MGQSAISLEKEGRKGGRLSTGNQKCIARQERKIAGYVSIQTIVPCSDEETFHDIVQRYLQALVSLGIAAPALLSWGQGLQWPTPDEQIMTEWPSMRGEAAEESIEIKLMFILRGNNARWVHIFHDILID